MMMVERAVKTICRILDLAVPVIDNDESTFSSPTMIAQVESGGRRIHIRKDAQEPDIIFALAHELRHLWQIENDEEFYFSDYKDVSEIGVEAYNLQAAEIDANAFGAVTMINLLDMQPLFYGLPENIKEKIWDRAAEIVELLN